MFDLQNDSVGIRSQHLSFYLVHLQTSDLHDLVKIRGPHTLKSLHSPSDVWPVRWPGQGQRGQPAPCWWGCPLSPPARHWTWSAHPKTAASAARPPAAKPTGPPSTDIPLPTATPAAPAVSPWQRMLLQKRQFTGLRRYTHTPSAPTILAVSAWQQVPLQNMQFISCGESTHHHPLWPPAVPAVSTW